MLRPLIELTKLSGCLAALVAIFAAAIPVAGNTAGVASTVAVSALALLAVLTLLDALTT